MTCPPHSPAPRNACLRWGLAVLAIAAVPAMSQPTGNPKGTAAPSVQGSSAKPPATRNRAVPKDDRQPDSTADGGSRAARSGNLRTPGIGTTGGLTGRHPGDGSGTGTTQTDQAPPAKR